MTAPLTEDVRIQILAEKGAAATAALKSTKQELRGIRTEATAGGQSFQRIRRDVAQAAVDFKRGAISGRDYAQALKFARLEAAQMGMGGRVLERDILRLNRSLGMLSMPTRITSQEFAAAERRMGGTAVATVKVAEASKKARQGLGTVRSTLGSLSAMAIGTKGTLGTLGGALLQFGAGNAIAIGILAGIAGIAAGIRLIGKSAREAKKEAEELVRTLLQAAERRRPEVDVLREQRAQIMEQLRQATTVGGVALKYGPGVPPVPGQAAQERRILELSAARRELDRQIAEAQRKTRGEIQQARTDEIGYLKEARELNILTLAERRHAVDLEKEITAELDAGNLSLKERNRLTREQAELRGVTRIDLFPLAGLVPPSARIAAGLGGPRRFIPSGLQRQALPGGGGPLAAGAGTFAELANQLKLVEQFLGPVVDKEALFAQRMAALDDLFRRGVITADERTEAEKKLAAAMGLSKIKTEQWASAAILATGQLAQMMIRGGGGAGGFLGGLLGIAGSFISLGKFAAAGPVGLGLATLGGIITAATSRRDPVPVRVHSYSGRALEQMRIMSPREFIFQFVNARGELTAEEIIYTTEQLIAEDRVVRIPGTRLGSV